MQIVIDIPEYLYKAIQSYKTPTEEEKAIANGTSLPKGHGMLVDYDEMKRMASEYGEYTEATLSHIKPKVLLEADKEQE